MDPRKYTDVGLLARAIQSEAGSESDVGKLAVAAVINNRRKSGQYGSGWSDVILAPGQFSAFNNYTGYAGGSGGNDVWKADPSDKALAIAQQVIEGGYEDPTGGAVNYFNPAIADPKWGRAGEWKAIGNHVFGTAGGNVSGGGGNPTMAGGQSKDTMGNYAMEPERRGLLFDKLPQGAQDYLTPERVARFQMAMEGMTLNPNKGIMASAGQTLKDSADRKKSNRTADYLAKTYGPKAAEAFVNGVPLSTIVNQANRMASGPTPRAQEILPNGTVIQSMSDGRVRVTTAGGQILEGEEAANAVLEAQQYGADLQGNIYGKRVEGANVAEANTGGAAAAAGARGESSIRLGEEYFKKYRAVQSSITGFDRAIAALDNGASSGVAANMLPNVTEASGELRAAMNELGLSVVAGTTFGALSAPELELALQTAVPQDLPPQELRSWLVNRKAAQIKAAQELANAAAFFNSGGTIGEYIESYGGALASAPTGGITTTVLPPQGNPPPQGGPSGEPDADGWIVKPNGVRIRRKQ